jgi:hypothetical protein
MKKISKKEKVAHTESKLLKLRNKLEERLHKTDLAMIGAKAISKELAQLKKAK